MKVVLIVTGDKDLLCLGEVQQILILSPGAFWSYEDRQVEQPGGTGG